MAERVLYEGTAAKRLWADEILYDDFEFEDYGREEKEITVYDVDAVLGYTVDILKLGIYLFWSALLIGVVCLTVQYL
jgi:hypothetical protein